jgi:hypothetical protein
MSPTKRRRKHKIYTKKEVVELQKKWYDKLKSDGQFVDLESFNEKTGEFGPYFTSKTSGDIRRTLEKNTHNFHYYSLLRNFLTHTKWRGNTHNGRFDAHAARLYTQGFSIPDIVSILKFRRIKSVHYSVVDYRVVRESIDRFVEAAKIWNRTHPEGLDFEPTTDELVHLKK